MLKDQLGRQINYLRVSLSDRCNFRCTYCMDESMQFAKQSENLSPDELLLICQAFVELGVEKIRLTGGEPLIHPDFPYLLQQLSALAGLQQIAITTNGTKIIEHLPVLQAAKVTQMNISLDSLSPETFRAITRVGDLAPVLAGIDAAIAAELGRIRLNVVVSKSYNGEQLLELLRFALEKAIHISFIEQMPLGDMRGLQRSHNYMSNIQVKALLAEHYALLPILQQSRQMGPAEYYRIAGCISEVGFISPHSNNFCSSCNRVRLTRKGELILCLGQEDALDLRAIVRKSGEPLVALKQAIVAALQHKPESHNFDSASDAVQLVRFMNVTGG